MASKKAKAGENANDKSLPKTPPKKARVSPPTSLNPRSHPKIKVLGFGPHFNFELYFYEKNATTDAFCGSLFAPIRGDKESGNALFDAANFIDIADRRLPGSNDERWMKPGSSEFCRCVIIRIPPNSDSTTPETRDQGLLALKSFLMDSSCVNFPPRNIDTVDITDDEKPASFDDYLLNKNIDKILQLEFDDEVLTSEFKTNYPECAKMCWKSVHVSDFARQLGF